jgi:hypothetical protein
LIVEDNRIATAGGFADSAKALPNRLNAGWSKHRGPGRFIKHLVTFVGDLHVLGRSHFAVCVRRRAVTSDAWERDAVKIVERAGHVQRRRSGSAVLHDRILYVIVFGVWNLGFLLASRSPFLTIGNCFMSRRFSEVSLRTDEPTVTFDWP